MYGHRGLSFSADKAVLIGELRDRRYKDVYQKILNRCLKQVQSCCTTMRSTMFVVPDRLCGDMQPYNMNDVMGYLMVALRDDRHYKVMRVNHNTLYISWSNGGARAKTSRVTAGATSSDTETASAVVNPNKELAEVNKLLADIGISSS